MRELEVFSPYNGALVGVVPFCGEAEVEAIINRAYEIHTDYTKRLPKYEIVGILERTAQIISERVEELTRLAASEGGKPYIDSKVEIERAINGVKIAIAHLNELGGKEIAMGQSKSSANKMAFTFKEPIGVVASISAFNHPFNLAVHQVIPAIAVGCPVIIKPATQTPLSAFKLVEILKEAGLPDGYATAIACDRKSASILASSPKIGFLSFIGSAEVGWSLHKSVANGVRTALEHGGVAPIIVEADADFSTLVPSLVKGGFYHAGQVCVSVQRIFAHKDIARKLAEEIAKEAKKLKVGDPLDETTEVGPLINKKEIERVESWINENHGGKILCGGKRVGESCYEPTVVFAPSDESMLSKKEVFAPVVCVYPYECISEAIKRANALDVSFQAAIYTQNIDKALKAVRELNATAVMVNENTAFRVDWMPFGGAKTSGIGVGGINYSMEEMCNTKMMVIKSPSI